MPLGATWDTRRIPQFSDLARPVLVAISRASGDTYSDIDGSELLEQLAEMGYSPEPRALYNLMFHLRDGGFVEFEAAQGMDPKLLFVIKLGTRGREQVEAWPTDAGLSAEDVEALLAILEARAEDPQLPEAERKKWRAILKAVRDIGVEAAGSLLSAWARSLGIP